MTFSRVKAELLLQFLQWRRGSECLHADVREHGVSDSQLLTRVDAAVLASQPLAIQEVRASQRRSGADS